MKSFLISAASVWATVAVLFVFMYFNPWVKLMETADIKMIVNAYNARVIELMMCRDGESPTKNGYL